jgi:hypothetical protein
MTQPPKLIWKYRYINGGNIVTPYEFINRIPDKHNRWMIVGYATMKTKAMPYYKIFGKAIHIPMVTIQQKGCIVTISSSIDNFCGHFSNIKDANIGYSDSYFYGETPNEVMLKIQEAFEQTYKCFLNFI